MGSEQQAQLEAEALSRRVLIQGLLRRLRGQPNQLLPYSAVLELRPKSEAYKGLQTIEVDKIRTYAVAFLLPAGLPFSAKHIG